MLWPCHPGVALPSIVNENDPKEWGLPYEYIE
jgi:hypothetical protein